MNDGDDIRVALSTSIHMRSMDSHVNEVFQRSNIPVCISEMAIGIFGGNTEREELGFAELMKNMCKEVFIDPARRYLFIGEDHTNDTTGLVEYTEDRVEGPSADFFIRWPPTQQLFFEHQVFTLKSDFKTFEPCFSIRGFWSRGKWSSIDIYHSNQITVVGHEP